MTPLIITDYSSAGGSVIFGVQAVLCALGQLELLHLIDLWKQGHELTIYWSYNDFTHSKLKLEEVLQSCGASHTNYGRGY